MKKILAVTIIFSFALFSTGCTMALWEDVELSKKTKVTYKKVTDDQVVAFGVARRDMGSIYKDSLIMMGEQYWYVFPAAMNKTGNKELLKALRADLPKQFKINPNDSDSAFKAAGKGRIPIGLGDKNYFALSVCLRYSAQNAKEQAILQSSGFNQGLLCPRRMIGQLYEAKAIPAEYRFEKPIPVGVLKVVSSKRSASVAKTATAVILTPITVPLDILGGIFIFGGMATGLIDMKLQ